MNLSFTLDKLTNTLFTSDPTQEDIVSVYVNNINQCKIYLKKGNFLLEYKDITLNSTLPIKFEIKLNFKVDDLFMSNSSESKFQKPGNVQNIQINNQIYSPNFIIKTIQYLEDLPRNHEDRFSNNNNYKYK